MTVTTGRKLDVRDGKWYRTVLMPDGNWWLEENLAWEGAGVMLGLNRVYQATEAVSSVPSGCIVPSDAEWSAMLDAGAYTVSDPLKSKVPTWDGSNASGFSAIPTGGIDEGGNAIYVGMSTYYWTRTTQDGGATYRYVGLYTNTFISGIERNPAGAAYYFAVRLIVTEGNIPDGSEILGATFSGLERGYSVSINRHVTAREAIGGGIRLIPQAPSGADAWTVEAEIRLTAEQSLAFEAAAGAYGTDTAGELRLPARGGLSTFCGLAPASFGAEVDTYIVTAMRNPESLGRVAPAVDLFAYRITFDLVASANTPIALTATVPAWLPQKWASHDLRDSSQWEVYASPSTGLPIHPAAKVKHGRGRGHSIALDALDDSQADHVVAWYRNSRAAPVTITIDRGPEGHGAVSVYLADLSLSRNMGLLWSGSLEVVEA